MNLTTNILPIQKRFCYDSHKLQSNFENVLLQVIFVEEYSDVTLQCRKCNKTFHYGETIHWYKGIRTEEDTFEDTLESESYKISDIGSVLIKNVTYFDDAGFYFCRIGERNDIEVGYDLKGMRLIVTCL